MQQIAVIDDDRAFLDLITDVLQDEGYDVITYAETTGTFALLRQLQPDLILLDLRIEQPGSGWMLVELLRMDAITAAIPLIVSSADQVQLRERETWLRDHGIGSLIKPFDLDELDALIARLLLRADTRLEELVP